MFTHRGIASPAHKISYNANICSLSLNSYKFVGVKPLPEEEALKKAIEFVSDFLVYSSAAGIVVIEAWGDSAVCISIP